MPLPNCERGGRPCESGARTAPIVVWGGRERHGAEFQKAPEKSSSLVPSAFLRERDTPLPPVDPKPRASSGQLVQVMARFWQRRGRWLCQPIGVGSQEVAGPRETL